MVRKKQVDAGEADDMARRFAAVAETKLTGLRRPNIRIEPAVEQGLRLAIERSAGPLVIPLKDAVELLRLSPGYTDPKRAYLLASALARKLRGISVGTRVDGKFLSFNLKH